MIILIHFTIFRIESVPRETRRTCAVAGYSKTDASETTGSATDAFGCRTQLRGSFTGSYRLQR